MCFHDVLCREEHELLTCVWGRSIIGNLPPLWDKGFFFCRHWTSAWIHAGLTSIGIFNENQLNQNAKFFHRYNFDNISAILPWSNTELTSPKHFLDDVWKPYAIFPCDNRVGRGVLCIQLPIICIKFQNRLSAITLGWEQYMVEII